MVTAVVEAANKDLWLMGARGVVRVPVADVRTAMVDPAHAVPPVNSPVGGLRALQSFPPIVYPRQSGVTLSARATANCEELFPPGRAQVGLPGASAVEPVSAH